MQHDQGNVLVDHSAGVARRLMKLGGTVHFINDNAGAETLMDLALIDLLLSKQIVNKVICHVKAYPTFVSDSMPKDWHETIAAMAQREEPGLSACGSRLGAHLAAGRIQLLANPFWNAGRFFWEMPKGIASQLQEGCLTIIKGDLNYRRLLGDCVWDSCTTMDSAAPYFPGAFVCLRTLKSNPVVGLKTGEEEALGEVDAQWRVNGKRGIIQAVGAS